MDKIDIRKFYEDRNTKYTYSDKTIDRLVDICYEFKDVAFPIVVFDEGFIFVYYSIGRHVLALENKEPVKKSFLVGLCFIYIDDSSDEVTINTTDIYESYTDKLDDIQDIFDTIDRFLNNDYSWKDDDDYYIVKTKDNQLTAIFAPDEVTFK